MSAPALAGPAGLPRAAGILFLRNARLTLSPRGLLAGSIGPLAYLAGFAITLSALLENHGVDPAMFLPPAIAVQAAMTTAISTAFTVAADRRAGMIDRLMCLPIRRAALPAAYLLAHVVRAAVPLGLLVLAAHLFLGFGFRDGVAGAAGFFGLALGFGLCLGLGAVAAGWRASDPEALGSLLYLPYLPLFIFSTGLVPVEAFPDWLQPVVAHSPISAVTDELRALAGHGEHAWQPMAWLAVLLVLFAWLAGNAVERKP